MPLNKETPPLLHSLCGFSSVTTTSIRAKNSPDTYIKIVTEVLMDVVTVAFLCSRLCYNDWLAAVSKIAYFKTIYVFARFSAIFKAKIVIRIYVSVLRQK